MRAIGSRLAIIFLFLTFAPRAASGAEGTGIRDPFPATQYGSLGYDRPGSGRVTGGGIGNGIGHAESLATISGDPATKASLEDRIASGKVAPFASAARRDDRRAGGEDDPASRVPGPGVMILLGSGLIALAEWGRRKLGKTALSN